MLRSLRQQVIFLTPRTAYSAMDFSHKLIFTVNSVVSSLPSQNANMQRRSCQCLQKHCLKQACFLKRKHPFLKRPKKNWACFSNVSQHSRNSSLNSLSIMSALLSTPSPSRTALASPRHFGLALILLAHSHSIGTPLLSPLITWKAIYSLLFLK